MGYYLILYNSVTFANRIKKHFGYNRDFLGVIHTPGRISQSGCSYSVKVKKALLGEVVEFSKKAGISVKGIFYRSPDGDYHEVGL